MYKRGNPINTNNDLIFIIYGIKNEGYDEWSPRESPDKHVSIVINFSRHSSRRGDVTKWTTLDFYNEHVIIFGPTEEEEPNSVLFSFQFEWKFGGVRTLFNFPFDEIVNYTRDLWFQIPPIHMDISDRLTDLSFDSVLCARSFVWFH